MALTSRRTLPVRRRPGKLPGARDRRHQDRDRARCAGADHRARQFRRGHRTCRVGRYPFGIALSPDDRTLFVTHVGVFQYTHLRPANPTGDANVDYPLCYPGAGYPDETRNDRVIEINKVDPRQSARQPARSRRHPLRIRPDRSPSTPFRDSAARMRRSRRPSMCSTSAIRAEPERREIVKTGPLVGEREDGIAAYSGSHPNAVVGRAGGRSTSPTATTTAFRSSIRGRYEERDRIGLSLLRGQDRTLRGRAAGRPRSESRRRLSCTWPRQASTRVGVIRLNGKTRREVIGHIPDRLVAEQRARQRRWQVVVRRQRPRPRRRAESGRREPVAQVQRARDGQHHRRRRQQRQLDAYTARVYANNGFATARHATTTTTADSGSAITTMGQSDSEPGWAGRAHRSST